MHLNVLNLRLQGRNENNLHLVGHVETFKMKLRLFATSLKNNDLLHFDSLHELLADDVEVECSGFVEDIGALSHEFDNSLSHKFELRNAPTSNCECGAAEQTAEHIILTCLVHRVPTGIRGLTILDVDTRCWLSTITASI